MRLLQPLNSFRDKWRWFVLNVVASSFWTPVRLRLRLWQAQGVEFGGTDCLIMSGCQIHGSHLRIGAETYINTGCQFHCGALVDIGAKCNIAMEVLFCTATHEIGDVTRRAGGALFFPIRVSDGCWIGARATIAPGVTIGAGCVVAAGAVVTKDCAPNGLYGGVPARRLRELS